MKYAKAVLLGAAIACSSLAAAAAYRFSGPIHTIAAQSAPLCPPTSGTCSPGGNSGN